MNWMNKCVVLILTVCSFSIHAEVNVSLHQDLELLVVKEKNVGFTVFDNNKFTLADGQSQIVIRVSKLITRQGQKEKFKSAPIVVTFNLTDTDLEISPTRTFFLAEKVKGFDKHPVIIAMSDGKNIDVKQDILERGVGMTRDYASELTVYNNDTNIVTASNMRKPVAAGMSSPLKMSQDLFAKASESEKEQFTEWAFKNRKSIEAPLNAEGKILPMLEYWYEKASVDEKAEILTWILAL